MDRTSFWSLVIILLLSLCHFELAHATASHLYTLGSRLSKNPQSSAGGKENLKSHYRCDESRVEQLSNEEICWKSVLNQFKSMTFFISLGLLQQPCIQRLPLQHMKFLTQKSIGLPLVAISAVSLNLLRTSPAYASTKNRTYKHSKKMKPQEIISRSLSFWRQATPIILHYKFTQVWLDLHSKQSHLIESDDDLMGSDRIVRYGPLTMKYYDRKKRDEIYETLHSRYADKALDIILEMRGLFIKIGQVLSSRPDFIPEQYVNVMQVVQDEVPPWNGEEIRDVVEESWQRNFGLSVDDILESFELEVLGSASIGQVHKGIVRQDVVEKLKSKGFTDNGLSKKREVAIKVMHLDAEDRFRNDFKIFKWLCRVALPGWSPILRELESQMMTEFDYHYEANNLDQVRKNMMASPYRKKVVIPMPVKEFCTQNVLIMEYLDGVKLESAILNDITDALDGNRSLAKLIMEDRRRALFQGNLNAEDVGVIENFNKLRDYFHRYPLHEQLSFTLRLGYLQWKQRKSIKLLLDVHGHQILQNGIFNGDCHPGNIIQLKNGLGLIDYGQCKMLSETERHALSTIVAELGARKVNEENVAEAMHTFGFRFENERNDTITNTARLFFDSDVGRREVNCPTPQSYLMHLQKENAMTVCPDAAVFVARTSFLFRGFGSLMGMEIHTSQHWKSNVIR